LIDLDPIVGHHRKIFLPSTPHGGSREPVPERIDEYMVAGHQFGQAVRVMCIDGLYKPLCDLRGRNVFGSHAESPPAPPDPAADHADPDLAVPNDAVFEVVL
jgi:hypothetical protein